MTQGWLLTDRSRQYTPAAKTTPQSITETLKRFGYVPPEQTRLEHQEKGTDK